MLGIEKWLTNVAGDCPAADAVKRIVSQRMLAVSWYLAAVHEDPKDDDAVHQLRTWCRRAEAALELFEPVFQIQDRRRLAKTLRRLRGHAGKVRDCDVQRKAVRHFAHGRATLRQAIKDERRERSQKLARIVRRLLERGRLLVDTQRALSGLRTATEAMPYREAVWHGLPPLSEAFFHGASTELTDDEALHALRIAGKRWRYGLELAAAVLPARDAEALYLRLGELQAQLGELHDQTRLLGRLEEISSRQKRGRTRWKRQLAEQKATVERLREDMLRRWSPWEWERLRRGWEQMVQARDTGAALSAGEAQVS